MKGNVNKVNMDFPWYRSKEVYKVLLFTIDCDDGGAGEANMLTMHEKVLFLSLLSSLLPSHGFTL